MRTWGSHIQADRRPLAGVLLIIAAALLGCSGGSGGTSQPQVSPTTTALVASTGQLSLGSALTLTCTVKSSGSPVTTGSVMFYDGTTLLASAPLSSSGQATWSSSSLGVGTHTFNASFGGTATLASSTSSNVAVTVSQPLEASVVTLLTSTPSTLQGLPVELKAQVTNSSSSSGATPTGNVTFSSGSTALGTASIDSTGLANFTSTKMPAGVDSITASYSGDTAYSGSASQPVTVIINLPSGATYTNPLKLNASASIPAVSCADPAIYKLQSGGVDTWYLYCTSDALYAGDPNPHFINVFHSSDLVDWTYDGDAFAGLPSWANVNGASLWAPSIKYFNGQYYLYFAASATALAGNGSAIGVGVSSSPTGPFVDSGAPVVEPEPATNCCSGSYRSTIDPDEIQDATGQRYILFGSFVGGLYVRKLSANGLTSDKTSEQPVAVDNRYEGGNWWIHGGYYYLFASSTNCCNGPLSGYGVFVGRATSPMGPYLDAAGIPMTAINPGGTPALRMNGNSVIGPGGNVVFTDEAGQDYMLYHGILAATPYYAGSVGYTARSGFIDAIDWVNGWPVVRGGFGASDKNSPQPLPAAQPAAANSYTSVLATEDSPGTAIASLSDDFSSSALSPQWSFLHATPSYALTNNSYQVNSVAYDPIGSMSNVPLLSEPAPVGDYMAETKVDINLPTSGVGPDFAQAGLLIYADDNNFVRADLYNNNDTRQVEFIKAETAQAAGYSTWGATNLGPASISTQVTVWLRIVKRNVDGEEHYTAFSSKDGVTWTRGGTWVHQLGSSEKICLYAGNRSGYVGTFHYVHVSTLQ
ncbi:family 43 glycosylhydrolase [Telmatobacter sp. DSM 110680]|uniref:Family 43 glycosylhydrolase n=1 Tax=Telmatobacter sp. DSM 110680 TaxID=3036704 RepID=A0AAU7DIE7_9BACT